MEKLKLSKNRGQLSNKKKCPCPEPRVESPLPLACWVTQASKRRPCPVWASASPAPPTPPPRKSKGEKPVHEPARGTSVPAGPPGAGGREGRQVPPADHRARGFRHSQVVLLLPHTPGGSWALNPSTIHPTASPQPPAPLVRGPDRQNRVPGLGLTFHPESQDRKGP